MEDLVRQKIDTLVSMNGYIFPDLVKAFYTNISYNEGVISYFGKGTPFNFDAKVLVKTMDIPSEGLEFKMHKTLSLQNYEKRDFYYGIGRKNEHGVFQKRKTQIEW